MKKNVNLIFIYVSISFAIFSKIFESFCCFKLKISFSDKDNNFNIILITAGIIEEYKIETI